MTTYDDNKFSMWQEFCYDLIASKANDDLEDEYQDLIENGFRQLGWSKAKKELCPKERLEVGNKGQLEPDITLKINERPVLVIEIKRPRNKIHKRQELQLLSYMRMVSVPIGLYIGEEIRLYYDYGSVGNTPPFMAWRTDIDSDADEGKVFIDFFQRETFNEQRIIDFCAKSYDENKTKEIMTSFSNALQVDQNRAMHEVLTEYFVNYKKCNPNFVQSLLETLYFTTTSSQKKNDDVMPKLSSYGMVTISGVNKSGRDTSKYSLDGSKEKFGKGKFVREVVARFVKMNPSLTFDQLKQVFPDNLQGSYGVLRTLDEIKLSNHDKKDLRSRYIMDEDKQLTSSDGVKFVVCNQWGTYNFANILSLLSKWGWNVIQDKKKQ